MAVVADPAASTKRRATLSGVDEESSLASRWAWTSAAAGAAGRSSPLRSRCAAASAGITGAGDAPTALGPADGDVPSTVAAAAAPGTTPDAPGTISTGPPGATLGAEGVAPGRGRT